MYIVRILLFVLPLSLVFTLPGNCQSQQVHTAAAFSKKSYDRAIVENTQKEKRLVIYEMAMIVVLLILLGLVVAYFKKKSYTRLLTEQKKEIQQQAAKLKELNQKMLQLDLFKKEMGSMMVHDLKNYLNAIVHYSEEKFPDSMEVINMSARQMLSEVSNILDVIKFDDSGMQLRLEPYDLGVLVDKAVRQVNFLLQAKNIRTFNKVESPLLVKVDPAIILRVLTNLLTNAVKHTPDNGEISIETHSMPGHRVCVSVIDNGEGIPREKLSLIFQKYQQVAIRKSGIASSTGLGLTYCRMAVHAHGEEIGVTSQKGEGSTFWFSLKSATTQ